MQKDFEHFRSRAHGRHNVICCFSICTKTRSNLHTGCGVYLSVQNPMQEKAVVHIGRRAFSQNSFSSKVMAAHNYTE